MSSKDLITEALSLPCGASFFRCALQVNPHHYCATYRGAPTQVDAQTYAQNLVRKAAESGISVLAVTDHNHVGGVALIREAASTYGIHVFPGFEIASSEGVHILCIYPVNTDEERLNRYLGNFGIHDPRPSSIISNMSLREILSRVREQGGITIAAHITNDKGLLQVLHGQARLRAWKDKNLLAVQIPGRVEDLPQEYRAIIENKNPDYQRARKVAVLNAKDVCKPEDFDDPATTTWIKMSEISIEALRQAFLDPDSRIRLNSDPVLEQHAELVAMAWEGGFLDGTTIHFNPNLNILIGGRGAGKSTIIESIRCVLGLEPLGEDARKNHERIVRHVLRSATKITMLVRTYRPDKKEYLIERTIPNPPVVRDENGQVSNLLPSDVLPRVEVYGQHELGELAKSPENLTHLLDRFVERDEALRRRKVELQRSIEKNRQTLLQHLKEIQTLEEESSRLPAFEETLKRFQDAGLEERLREQGLVVREERVLESIPERLAPFRECLETLERETPIDRTFLSDKALEELPGREILKQADNVLERLSRELQGVADKLKTLLERAEQEIAQVRKQWQERKDKAQQEYEKILRQLQQAAIDAEEYLRLRRQIERLRPLRERKKRLETLCQEYTEQRKQLLAEWENLKAQEFRLLDRAAKRVNQALRERVQVEVKVSGNREPLFALLRNEIGGRLSEAIGRLAQVEDFSLPAFINACRQGKEALVREFDIPAAQAERLAGISEEVLMRAEELELPPTTTIRLNIAAPGQPPIWQALDELSTGQKATAVLLLILLESDAPLVVDQPEDDLDNRFVTEGVVPSIRAEKRRRQFIFSTHNANIPVLGDAELILGLTPAGEAEGGRAEIRREHMGSIDTGSIRELVEEVLEGGKDAFEMRRLKYGF
ncbi:MAG: phosphoesterase [Pirellulaceae bacterium]|nr:MAG: phosphoesterase [Pirellulaceae bacterium]